MIISVLTFCYFSRKDCDHYLFPKQQNYCPLCILHFLPFLFLVTVVIFIVFVYQTHAARSDLSSICRFCFCRISFVSIWAILSWLCDSPTKCVTFWNLWIIRHPYVTLFASSTHNKRKQKRKDSLALQRVASVLGASIDAEPTILQEYTLGSWSMQTNTDTKRDTKILSFLSSLPQSFCRRRLCLPPLPYKSN